MFEYIMIRVIMNLVREDLESINNTLEMTEQQFFNCLYTNGSVYVKTLHWHTGNPCAIHWQYFDGGLIREIQFIDGTYTMSWDKECNLTYNQ